MSNSRYTAAEIEAMRQKARDTQCTANALFWLSDAKDLIEVCNGVGAEDAAKWERDALTFIFRNYAAAAAIHDCRYEESDGTETARKVADDEFRANCLRLWADRFGAFRWLRPAAWVGRTKVNAAYVAVREFGGDAWRDACDKNDAKEVAM